MFESIINFFKKIGKTEKTENQGKSKDAAKERLHLVLMQDRANVSADFLDLMKQEIIEVIKKYIDVDENAIDVRLTNKANGDGTTGAPALYANIPIVSIKEEVRGIAKEQHIQEKEVEQKTEEEEVLKENKEIKQEEKQDEKKEEVKTEEIQEQEETKAQKEIEVKNEIVEEKKEEATQNKN